MTGSLKRRRRASSAIVNVILAVTCLVMLAPIAWLATLALKSPAELAARTVRLMPESPNWGNYLEALTYIDFFGYARNSLTIALISATLTTLSSSFVAFGLARCSAPGKRVVFGLLLGTMMLPAIVTAIPSYMLFSKMHLLDTYVPWVLMGLGGSAYMIFLIRQSFLGVPTEIDEAAVIDGCSPFQIWWRMYLPMSKAVLACVFLLSFIWAYSDYLMPKLLLSTQTTTLSVAVGSFYTDPHGQVIQPLMAAGAIWFSLPAVLIFLLMQRYFVQGFATSGIK